MKITIKGAKPDGSDNITGELQEITRTGGTLLQEDGKVVGFPLADIVAIRLSDEVTVQMEVTGFTFNRPSPPLSLQPAGSWLTYNTSGHLHVQGPASKFELGRAGFYTNQPQLSPVGQSVNMLQETMEPPKPASQDPIRKVTVTYITRREVYVKKTEELLGDLYTASDKLKKEFPGAEILGAVDQGDTSVVTGLGTP